MQLIVLLIAIDNSLASHQNRSLSRPFVGHGERRQEHQLCAAHIRNIALGAGVADFGSVVSTRVGLSDYGHDKLIKAVVVGISRGGIALHTGVVTAAVNKCTKIVLLTVFFMRQIDRKLTEEVVVGVVGQAAGEEQVKACVSTPGVGLVDLEAVNADRNLIFLVNAPVQIAGLFHCQVGDDTAKGVVTAAALPVARADRTAGQGVFQNVAVDLRLGRNVGMLPQVDVQAQCVHAINEAGGVGGKLGAPSIAARISLIFE